MTKLPLRTLSLVAVLGALAVGSSRASTPVPPDSLRFRAVAASYGYTCGIALDGGLYCWGLNLFDREPGRRVLGREIPRPGRASLCGIVSCRKTPLRLLERSTFTQVAATGGGLGGVTVCAIQSDGKAFCWGSRGYGQTGADERVGGVEDTALAPPREVRTSVRFTAIAVGGYHACGIATDSSAYCWGQALSIGMPGGGTPCGGAATCFVVPTPVGAGAKFLTLSAATDLTCGLRADGRAVCWGEALTLAPTTQTFRTISAGQRHACGIGTDDVAYCWGRGTEGQLGSGAAANAEAPVAVAGGLRFRAIAAGDRYTCGVTTEGAAQCWGLGAGGQLGAGDTTSSNLPRPVTGGLTFQSIAAGHDHTCAVTGDGSVYCWGKNGWGNLGTGNRDDSLVPVRLAEP